MKKIDEWQNKQKLSPQNTRFDDKNLVISSQLDKFKEVFENAIETFEEQVKSKRNKRIAQPIPLGRSHIFSKFSQYNDENSANGDLPLQRSKSPRRTIKAKKVFSNPRLERFNNYEERVA